VTLSDVLFVALVLGLPIAVSVRLFKREPTGRPFLATYVLAVLGSSLLFSAAAFLLMIVGVGGLGPFDGLLAVIVSVPAALLVGIIVRYQRRRAAL
jgi:hypothetical protein